MELKRRLVCAFLACLFVVVLHSGTRAPRLGAADDRRPRELALAANPYSSLSYACRESLRETYPEAMSAPVLSRSLTSVLAPKGMTRKNTLYGTATCPDEINRMLDQLKKSWGDCFTFSGLAGLPFTGKTGFAAFASHTPDNGNIFILFAPHIGLSSEGVFGKVRRPGMNQPSGACGSILGALKAVTKRRESDSSNGHPIDFTDFQQGDVERIIDANYQRIVNSPNPEVTATEVVYNEIKRRLFEMIPKDIKIPVAILGGIQVNTDRKSYKSDNTDFFVPRDFLYKGDEDDLFTDQMERLRRAASSAESVL